MKRSVRIGGAGGYWGDSNSAMRQLVEIGNVQYIIHDYLAELTMAILAKQRQRNPEAGYATDFVTLQLRPLLRQIAEKRIRIVANAGGINPHACARALTKLIEEAGVKLSVGVVDGDDLMQMEQQLRKQGIVEMFTGDPLPESVTSMNAYIGAFPIAAALDHGADIVVTGRAADSALVLGPLIHEFGWEAHDFDRLAAGTLAGHIIECGTQTTGGLFTDWEKITDRADMGYPIAECFADGIFHLTKAPGTGGLITPLSAAEQMLYEVTDPRNYLLPDVAVDLSEVEIEQLDDDVVRFSKVKGRAPTDTYKVSAVYTDGYRATATLTMIGRNASAKADLVGNAILDRVRNHLRSSNLGEFSETKIECIGSEVSSFGKHARDVNPREVLLRVAVRHPKKDAIELFAREVSPFGTAGTPGTTGFSGRSKAQQVFRLFSFLIEKDALDINVSVDGKDIGFTPPKAPGGFRNVESPSRSVKGSADISLRSVPLRSIAVARSGDKADIAHLAVIARNGDFYSALWDQLTTDQVRDYFEHLVEGNVARHDVPGTNAMIFTMEQALGGGGTLSLRSDSLGKAFGEIALDMEISVPEEWTRHPDFRLCD